MYIIEFRTKMLNFAPAMDYFCIFQSKEEKNGSDKKSSSKKKSSGGGDEKFMRVKLDASDSSDNEEKALKRKDKIEAERENKKKKKAALESSDDEIMEVEAGRVTCSRLLPCLNHLVGYVIKCICPGKATQLVTSSRTVFFRRFRQ